MIMVTMRKKMMMYLPVTVRMGARTRVALDQKACKGRLLCLCVAAPMPNVSVQHVRTHARQLSGNLLARLFCNFNDLVNHAFHCDLTISSSSSSSSFYPHNALQHVDT